jgi:hypothetical protein
VRCITADGDSKLAEPPSEQLAAVALRDALARWQRGEPPATGPEDCHRAMGVVDRAYEIAQR